MTPLTAEKIAELERLLAAATAGPWESLRDLEGEDADIRSDNDGELVGRMWSSRDGDLIAAMHEALPYLLSLAKRVADVDDYCDGLLNRLEGWGKAYPIDIFSEPSDEERDWLHATKLGLMGRISASMGRHMARMTESDLSALRVALVEIVGGEEG